MLAWHRKYTALRAHDPQVSSRDRWWQFLPRSQSDIMLGIVSNGIHFLKYNGSKLVFRHVHWRLKVMTHYDTSLVNIPQIPMQKCQEYGERQVFLCIY